VTEGEADGAGPDKGTAPAPAVVQPVGSDRRVVQPVGSDRSRQAIGTPPPPCGLTQQLGWTAAGAAPPEPGPQATARSAAASFGFQFPVADSTFFKV
jgi:hypothetical protein